jgi:hypothetical protein
MFSEHCRVQQTLKGFLVGERIINMRVLDTLGCLTLTNNTSEQLDALKKTARDQEHLLDDGYQAMAAGLLKEAISLGEPREKVKRNGNSRQQTTDWNGFISHLGIVKTSLKAAKKAAIAYRPTPYSQKGR